MERLLRRNLSIKQVNLQLDYSFPNELIKSCFIGVLCNRTVTDISLEAASKFCDMCDSPILSIKLCNF